jgi:mannose-6-phosphate isomerase
MDLEFKPEDDKQYVFQTTASYLSNQALKLSSVDQQRPWGGFFVIDESQTQNFIDNYFPDYPIDQISHYGNKLSPKILVVEPNKRLSWQYHLRRAELWRVINGPVGLITGDNDTQGPVKILNNNDVIQFDPLTRHRLIGQDNWGVVAEIWQHSNIHNPSNEEDIVRVQDDYGR